MERNSYEDRDNLCLICSSISTGIHFGIDACRACAAFFRRCVVENKEYLCRTRGKCYISKNVRNMCRKCRLQKCLDAGMKKSSVRGKRDPIIPKFVDPNPLCAVPMEDEASCSVETVADSYPPIIEMQPPQLLTKALINYRQLCSIRRATELALDPSIYSKMIPAGPLMGLSLGTSGKLSIFNSSQIPAVTEFVANTFEHFCLLDNEERWLLLRPFLVYFCWIDCGYKTLRRVAKEDFTTYFVVSETMYFDMAHCDDFVNDILDKPDRFKSSISSFVKKMMRKENIKSMLMMEELQLRDEEYMALLGLLLWSSCNDYKNMTENMKRIIQEARSVIFEELSAFQRLCSEPFPATRFGEILNIYSVFMMEMMRTRESLELFTALDVFKESHFFYEIVRCMK